MQSTESESYSKSSKMAIKVFPLLALCTLFFTSFHLAPPQPVHTGPPALESQIDLLARSAASGRLPSLDSFLERVSKDMYFSAGGSEEVQQNAAASVTVQADSPMRRRPLASLNKLPFIHVPKTAGTWFRKAIEGVANETVPGQFAEHYQETSKPPANAKWLYGHLVTLKTFAEVDTVHVTWFRRPMQRLISNFFFHLREYDLFTSLNQTIPWHMSYVRPNMSVEEWIKNSYTMTRFLCDTFGPGVEAPLHSDTDRLLKIALAQPHMAEFKILFPTGSLLDLDGTRDRLRVMYQLRTFPLVVERFPDSLRAFSRALFGGKNQLEGQLLAIADEKQNAASKKDRKATLSWEDVRLFEEAAWLDLIHYDVATEVFDRNLKQLGIEPAVAIMK